MGSFNPLTLVALRELVAEGKTPCVFDTKLVPSPYNPTCTERVLGDLLGYLIEIYPGKKTSLLKVQDVRDNGKEKFLRCYGLSICEEQKYHWRKLRVIIASWKWFDEG